MNTLHKKWKLCGNRQKNFFSKVGGGCKKKDFYGQIRPKNNKIPPSCTGQNSGNMKFYFLSSFSQASAAPSRYWPP